MNRVIMPVRHARSHACADAIGGEKLSRERITDSANSLATSTTMRAPFAEKSEAVDAIRSLAVLPFVNSSGDPQMEYLSDGLTESIIFALSKLPQVRVMARSAVFRH